MVPPRSFRPSAADILAWRRSRSTISTRREAFILVSRPPSEATKVVLPSLGVEEVTAMTRGGRSRLPRLMAVNTARIASAAGDVVFSSTWATTLERCEAAPLTSGTMPSTPTPVASSTWAAERNTRSSFSAATAPAMPSRQPITKAAIRPVL